MKAFFAVLLAAHGLVHLMGTLKAFRLASLPQLTSSVSPAMGLVWLLSALLFVAATTALFIWPRWWWAVGVVAIAFSQWAIATSWTDAKFGTVFNGVAAIGALFGFLTYGPTSLRAEYERDVDRGLARPPAVERVTNADLAHLPPPVQRFLRTSGVIGQPKVWNVRARMHGRIRSGPDAPWMPFIAEQHNVFDRPSRLFYMTASRMFVPFQGYHRYVGPDATMRVQVAGLVPVVDTSGDAMTQAETVTLFNDMCLLAPATLIDPGIGWEAIDDQTVRAAFTNAGWTIRAELSFAATGELVNFWSDDRRQTAPDGQTMRPMRWSTPLGAQRSFGLTRLSADGEARWHEPQGDYAYIQIQLDDVQYNVARR